MAGMTTARPGPRGDRPRGDRGPLVLLAALAVLLLVAGVLPWVAGGAGAARALSTPLALAGLLAGYAVLRATRPQRPAPPRRWAGGCHGCGCGPGVCALAAARADDAG
jgi:hypothetical protein